MFVDHGTRAASLFFRTDLIASCILYAKLLFCRVCVVLV